MNFRSLFDKFKACARLRSFLSTFCFVLLLLALDLGLRYIHAAVGITSVRSWIPNLFTLAWVAMLGAVTHLLPRLARRIACGLIGTVYTVLFLVHSVMYYAKGAFFSFSSLIFAGDGLAFLEPEYLRVRKLVWFIFLCGLCATALVILLVPKTRRTRLGWILTAAAAVLVTAGSVTAIDLNRENNLTDRLAIHFNMAQASLIYDDFSDSNEALMLSGLYQYTFRDFCLTYGVYDAFSRISEAETVRELDEWYASKEIDPDNEYTGLFEGKNLILIQLEAIDTWMITEEFMPNLYALKQESLDFVHLYTPLYLDAGTFNTEMIVNTGLVSPFTGSKSSMYSHNDYSQSLANLMTEIGYTARSFHRSTGSTYNRAEVHENWGYEHYYSGTEMGMVHLDFDENMMAAYDLMVSEEPFLTFIITYSGHGAYIDSDISAEYYDWAASLLPEGTNEMAIHAYAHAYATDRFIGALVEQLEADGLLEDTVLVFYSDHYNYYTLDTGLVMEMKGVYDENLITNTPFFIYQTDLEAQTVEKYMGAYDILPTLVNLFGLDTDGRYYVGNDAFSDNGGYAIFADYSWYDGVTYWNTMAGETATEEIAARNEEIQTRLKMSWNTMKLNYLATLD